MTLQGKTAVITGAGGSIGAAVARAFAAAGANVCACDIGPVATTVEAVRGLGARACALQVDVSRADDLSAMVQAAEREFGGIDIFVPVAGVTGFGQAATLSEAEWDRIMNINLKGVFFSCQAVIPSLRRRGGGRIITIGSILGKNGGNARPWLNPDEQAGSANVAYGASKAGVHAMTFYLARELAASNITVNSVAPGPVASAMTANFPPALRAAIPLNRLGTADDVAAAITFLAGESAAFITGEVLDVNGGMWAD